MPLPSRRNMPRVDVDPVLSWLTFIEAALYGDAATQFARVVALRFGVVNNPNPRVPTHTEPVAYLGGVGVALGALAASLSASDPIPARLTSLPLAAAVFLALGVLDDLRAFKPAPKFALQCAAAAFAVYLGFSHHLTGNVWIDAFTSWFWILTMVNAFNFIDVCDGLAGGTAILAFLALGALQPDAWPLVAALCGATAGFLRSNLPPASIYAGDGGSHLFGFLAAALALSAPPTDGPLTHVARVGLILALPLFDLVFVTAVRLCKGIPWWRGSADHVALRLQVLGLSRRAVDVLLWSLASVAGVAGVLLDRLPPVARVALVASFAFGLLVAALALVRAEGPRRDR